MDSLAARSFVSGGLNVILDRGSLIKVRARPVRARQNKPCPKTHSTPWIRSVYSFWQENGTRSWLSVTPHTIRTRENRGTGIIAKALRGSRPSRSTEVFHTKSRIRRLGHNDDGPSRQSIMHPLLPRTQTQSSDASGQSLPNEKPERTRVRRRGAAPRNRSDRLLGPGRDSRFTTSRQHH